MVIAFSNDSHEQTLDVIRLLQDQRVQVDIVPRMFEVLGASAEFHAIEGIPLVGLAPPHLSNSSRFLKRCFDVIGATFGLIVLSPVFLAAAIAIKVDTRGPVFFRQVRMGEDERTFRIFKFRTMVVDAETRKAEVAHLNMHQGGRSAHVQGAGGSARDPRRGVPPPLADRRAPAADQRAQRARCRSSGRVR